MEAIRNHPKRKAFMAAAVAAACAMVFATFAKADGPTPVVYFGAHGGKSFASTELTVDGVPGLSLDGIGSKGYVGGIHGGADLLLSQRDGLNPFVGVFGGYSWQNTEANLTLGPGVGLSMSLGDSYYGGARLGLASSGGVKGYGLIAYRHTDLGFSSPLPIPAIGPSSVKGWDIGAGIEMPVAKHMSFGIEGIWTKYDTADVTIAGTPTPLNLDIDALTVMGRFNITFGGVQSIFVDEPAPCDPKFANCKRAAKKQ